MVSAPLCTSSCHRLGAGPCSRAGLVRISLGSISPAKRPGAVSANSAVTASPGDVGFSTHSVVHFCIQRLGDVIQFHAGKCTVYVGQETILPYAMTCGGRLPGEIVPDERTTRRRRPGDGCDGLASLFPGKCARASPAHAFGSRPGRSHIAREAGPIAARVFSLLVPSCRACPPRGLLRRQFRLLQS